MTDSIVIKSISSTKDLLTLHALNPARYPFLLESLVDSPLSQYNILFAFPQQTITSKSNGFLAQLSQQLVVNKNNNTSGIELPFVGGWFLMLDYELNQEIEPSLNFKYKSKSYATRIPTAIIQDKLSQTTYFVAEEVYSYYMPMMQADFAAAEALAPVVNCLVEFIEENPQQFLDAVAKIKQYIIAGDVFQVNLSRLWQGETILQAYQVYQKLRQANPALFSALAVTENLSVISSSPERLVKLSNDIIQVRPIAGTSPRSNINQIDKNLADELLAHPKERAEHIMLVDLVRNDLGRVCEFGSITADELMILESYTHVHHIVSNVKGKLAGKSSIIDIIKAVFPGGTITGCPKIRCMQIINELEGCPRGVYTGSLGYLSNNGNMDLNILIRTIEQQGSQLKFRAGAGIVYDSIAEQELNETRVKAKGLIR